MQETLFQHRTRPSLRDYQQETLEKIRDLYDRGTSRLLLVAATGLGKTVNVAFLPEYFPELASQSMLFLVHRRELVDQAADKIKWAWPGMNVQIEMASDRAQRHADVVVASIQTLGRKGSRRLQKFSGRFGIIVVDEAHHISKGSQYERVLDFFSVGPAIEHDGTLISGRRRLLLGVTATPNRHDGQGLHLFFDDIATNLDIRWGVENGWLVDIIAHRVTTTTDLSGVSSRAGDFAVGELATAVNIRERNDEIVKGFVEKGGKKAIAFCADIAHAVELADAFGDFGIEAHAVHSGNAKHEIEDYQRNEIIEAFRRDRFPVLTNVGITCLDENTEVLTLNGWKGIDDASPDDMVAGWYDGQVVFEKPFEILTRDRLPGERMVIHPGSHGGLRVTEDHRMLYRTVRNGKFKTAYARELVDRRIEIPVAGIAQPLDIRPKPRPVVSRKKRGARVRSLSYVLRQQDWDSDDARVEAERRVDRRIDLSYNAPKDLSIDECHLIGFWLGDGASDELQNGGIEHKLYQAKAYPHIIKWIDDLVDRLPYDYSRRETTSISGMTGKPLTMISWSFPRGTGGGSQEREGLFPIEPYLVKHGTPLFWGLDEKQFAALIEGLWYADGAHGSGEVVPSALRIEMQNESLLSLLQAIAACRGYKTLLRTRRDQGGNEPLMRLTLTKQSTTFIANNRFQFEEPSDQSERVWCYRVPADRLIVRSRGRVYVTHNTEGFDAPSVDTILMARPTKSQPLYIQILGRATRPPFNPTQPTPEERVAAIKASEKPAMHVVDFTDNCGKHSVISVPKLFGLEADFDAKDKSIIAAVKTIEAMEEENPGRQLRKAKSLDEVQIIAEQISVWDVAETPESVQDVTGLHWMEVSDGVYQIHVPGSLDKGSLLSTQHDQRDLYIRLEPDRLGRYQATVIKPPVWEDGNLIHSKQVSKSDRIHDSKEEAITAVDDYLQDTYGNVLHLVSRGAKWEKKPATEKQLRFLKKLNVYIPEHHELDRGQASRLINAAKAQKAA